MRTSELEKIIAEYESRLSLLERNLGDLSTDVHLVLEVARQGADLSLHKMRKICEEILFRVCRASGLTETEITKRPTIERMKGPLVDRGILNRQMAAHVETILSFANPASHATEETFTFREFRPPFESLLSLVEWYVDAYPVADGKSMSSGSGAVVYPRHSAASLAHWRKAFRQGTLEVELDCRDDVVVHDLRSALEDSLDGMGYSLRSVDDAGVALTELCTNVGKHAQPAIGNVRVDIDREAHRLSVKVASRGEPFTYEEGYGRYAKESPEEAPVHGFGNLLLRGETSVQREGKLNVVQWDTRLVPAKELAAGYIRVWDIRGRYLVADRYYTSAQWCRLAFDFFGRRQGVLPSFSRDPFMVSPEERESEANSRRPFTLSPEERESEMRFFEYLIGQMRQIPASVAGHRVNYRSVVDESTQKPVGLQAAWSFHLFCEHVERSGIFRISHGEEEHPSLLKRMLSRWRGLV